MATTEKTNKPTTTTTTTAQRDATIKSRRRRRRVATTEETNRRDGGGRGEKRRQHDNKLEAVAAELARRSAVAAAVAAVVAAGSAAQSGLPQFFGEKRPISCVTEKNTKKAIPIPIRGLPELISKSGSPRIGMGFIPIWGPTHTYAFLRFCVFVLCVRRGGGWLGGCSFSDAGGQTTMTPEEGGEVCGDLSVYAFWHPSPPPSILSSTFYHKFLRHLWALL